MNRYPQAYIRPHDPYLNDHNGLWRRRFNPWGDPFLDGAFAAPLEAWGPASAFIATGIWIFVIIAVCFMILFGGPRY